MRPGSWLVAASSLAVAAYAGTAVTIDDEAIECRLVEIDAAAMAHLITADDKPLRVSCKQLQSIRIRTAPPAPRPGDSAIVLRGGGVLRGAIRGGSERAVTVQSRAYGTVECPLQAIAGVRLAGGEPARAADERPGKLDCLVLRNGEELSGTVVAIAEGKVTFRSEVLGQLDMAFDRLAAIAFAAEEAPRRAPPGSLLAIVHTDDGSTLTGRIRTLAKGKINVQTLFGAALTSDVARVLHIEFRGGRLVHLSDLEAAEVKETPFFDVVWRHRRDRSVDGGPLRIGTHTYRKGLGVHSRCELTYAIEGAYSRFMSDFGIDEEVGDRGNVDVTVLVDGKVCFERKGITGRHGPIRIAIDVAKAKRLTLRVDFGAELDICDHADWGNARLIR